jgi:thiamine-monophosphate kinase
MTFEPRIAAALEINRRLRPHAMIDISDGLALDLGRILEASGHGAVIEADRLDAAIHDDARRLAADDGQPPRDHALHDGEDFELIAVLPADVSASECARLGLLALGEIKAESGLYLEEGHGSRRPIPIRGWEHFQ